MKFFAGARVSGCSRTARAPLSLRPQNADDLGCLLYACGNSQTSHASYHTCFLPIIRERVPLSHDASISSPIAFFFHGCFTAFEASAARVNRSSDSAPRLSRSSPSSSQALSSSLLRLRRGSDSGSGSQIPWLRRRCFDFVFAVAQRLSFSGPQLKGLSS